MWGTLIFLLIIFSNNCLNQKIMLFYTWFLVVTNSWILKFKKKRWTITIKILNYKSPVDFACTNKIPFTVSLKRSVSVESGNGAARNEPRENYYISTLFVLLYYLLILQKPDPSLLCSQLRNETSTSPLLVYMVAPPILHESPRVWTLPGI